MLLYIACGLVVMSNILLSLQVVLERVLGLTVTTNATIACGLVVMSNILLSLQVVLERVLGLTVTTNATIACDPNSGIIAYPAG